MALGIRRTVWKPVAECKAVALTMITRFGMICGSGPRGRLCPPGDAWRWQETAEVTARGVLLVTRWVEARDAARHHPVHRTAPPHRRIFQPRMSVVLRGRNPALLLGHRVVLSYLPCWHPSAAVCSKLCILIYFRVFGDFCWVTCCFSALEENLLVPPPIPPTPTLFSRICGK